MKTPHLGLIRRSWLIVPVQFLLLRGVRMLLEWFVYYYHNHRQRTIALAGALLIMVGLATSLPLAQWLTNKNYVLDAATLKTIGTANPKLANKLVFNPDTKLYEFNADAKQASGDDPAAVAERLKHKVTGDASNTELYALDISPDNDKGMTVYDVNSSLSFKIIPQFHHMPGRKVQDRLVYPLKDDVKAIYTVKDNGLKEDIVFKHSPEGGAVSYSYQLKLPDTLEARQNEDGSVGIYSADPNLFGDISYGSDQDQEKVESARKNAPKNHKIFTIPAPVITTTNDSAGKTRTWLSLEDNLLTVHAENLNTIKGTFSIDPSVTVTSSSDFATGNDEGNTDFSTTNEIKRGGLTGGEVGSWNTTTSIPYDLYGQTTVAYNDFLYIIGGSGTAYHNEVQYAPINANGTIGTWTATTSFNNARYAHGSVVYNGYIYICGGYVNTTYLSDCQYSKINTNGTVGTWTATSNLPSARAGHTAAVYEGYVYMLGGHTTGAGFTDVLYAPIRADGSLGAWGATTSFTNGRQGFGVGVKNGYMYITGGESNGTYYGDVQYTKINSDGSAGTWTATNSLPATRGYHTSVIYGGYLYVIGGSRGTTPYLTDIIYAPIYANGTVGSWTTSNNFTNDRKTHAAVAYKGYIYIEGGLASTGYTLTDVQYAPVTPVGVTSNYSSTTSIPTTRSKGKDYGLQRLATVAYNGYMYTLGGYQNGGIVATVYYATINNNGTLGAWGTTTSLSTSRYEHTAVAYNGYMYVLGGSNGSSALNDVQYAPINTNGSLGTWTATSSFTTARVFSTTVVNNGYLYVLGGGDNSTANYNDVQYAPFNSNGTLGTWTSTTGFTTGRRAHAAVVNGGFVYVLGGVNYAPAGAATYLNDVQYAPFNSNGTLGTWVTTTSFSTGREMLGGVVSKGFIYILGGTSNYGSDYRNDVQYAPINSNGTLGTWVTTTSFSTGRVGQGTEIYKDYIYVIAGVNTMSGPIELADVQYAQINNGGPGTISSWTNTTILNTGTSYAASVAYNGYLYTIGDGSLSFNVIQYAPINSDGTLGNWASTVGPTALRGQTAAAHNGYLYVIGGSDGTYKNSVYYASIYSDGTIGTWASTTSFTNGRSYHTSELYNGYLYVIGGFNGVALNDVQYAPINSNGTIGSWAATTSFTTARYSLSSIAAGGHLYIVGGTASQAMSDVQYAPINSNGTIGSWAATSSLNVGRFAHSSVAGNGYIYVIGGAGSNVSDVQYAPINSNGTIGSWAATSSLNVGRSALNSVLYKGYIYAIGGNDGSGYDTVEVASMRSISRVARYSKLIDLGTVTNVSSITYTGSLPNGVADLKFRSAGSNGIFGADTSLSSLGGTCATSVSARYIWLSVSMSDSTTAVYRDALSTHSSLQDITLTYGSSGSSSGVNPGERLHGGKFFDNTEVLQPLDTAKNISGGGGGTCS